MIFQESIRIPVIDIDYEIAVGFNQVGLNSCSASIIAGLPSYMGGSFFSLIFFNGSMAFIIEPFNLVDQTYRSCYNRTAQEEYTIQMEDGKLELFVFIMLASLALIVSDFQAVRTASRIAEAAEIPYVKININGFVRYPAAALTNNSEVFLTQGIVDLASSESEIAAVIAHEVAHDLNTGILCNLRTLFFTRKDVLFGFLLSCSISIKIGLAVLFAIMAIQVTLRWLVGMAYRNELNRVGQVCFLILFGVNAIQGWVCIALLIICFGLRSFNPAELIGEFVITLTYLGWAVKEEEYKADRIAVELIAKAGYDPNGFVTMFSKFPKEKISWLARHYKSRHPTTLSRINRIRREIKRKYS